MITNVLNGNQLDTKQQPSTKNLQDQFHYIQVLDNNILINLRQVEKLRWSQAHML